MQTRFTVSHGGEELGPFSEDEIKHMLVTNQLLPVDYLFDESKQDWIMIAERFDLRSVAKEKGPPRPNQKAQKVASTSAYPEIGDEPPPQSIVARRQPVQASGPTNTVTGVKLAPVAPLAPLIPQPAAARRPAPSDVSETSLSAVQFSGGVGTVSIKQLKAGRVVVKLKNMSNTTVALPPDTIVDVQPGPARRISWELPSEVKAGEDLRIVATARDAFENVTTLFNGELEVAVRGHREENHKFKFLAGQGQLTLKWVRAETLELEIVDPYNNDLELPPAKPLAIKPGPVASLLIESPNQTQAGENLPVTVKAVDAHGNLVPDFKGEVVVGVAIEVSPTSTLKAS